MVSAYLIVIITTCTGGGCQSVRSYPMETIGQCQDSVRTAKAEVSKGGDSEGSIAMFCVKEKP